MSCLSRFIETEHSLKINFVFIVITFIAQIVAFSATGWISTSENGKEIGEQGLWEHCYYIGVYSCCKPLEEYMKTTNLTETPVWIETSRRFQIIGFAVGFTTITVTFCCAFLKQSLGMVILDSISFLLNFATSGVLMYSMYIYLTGYTDEEWIQFPAMRWSSIVALIVSVSYNFNGWIMLLSTCLLKKRLKFNAVQPNQSSQSTGQTNQSFNNVQKTNSHSTPVQAFSAKGTGQTNQSFNNVQKTNSHSTPVQAFSAKDQNDTSDDSSDDDHILAPSRRRKDKQPNATQDELPSIWSPMNDKPDTIPIYLGTDTDEYKEVQLAFEVSMVGRKHIITSIQRIQSTTLYKQYVLKREKLSNELTFLTRPQLEKQLWHGTTKTSVDGIIKYGFDRSFNGKNATAYGQGSYFARDASYSAKYANRDERGLRRMFRCRVLVGRYTKGIHKFKRPPFVKGDGNVRYNSTVDKTYEPSIFVIYNDTQAYPEYLITFAYLN